MRNALRLAALMLATLKTAPANAAERTIFSEFGVNVGARAPDLRTSGYEELYSDEYGAWWQRKDVHFFGRVDLDVRGEVVVSAKGVRDYEHPSGVLNSQECRNDLARLRDKVERRYPNLQFDRVSTFDSVRSTLDGFVLSESLTRGRRAGRYVSGFCIGGGARPAKVLLLNYSIGDDELNLIVDELLGRKGQ